MHQSAMSTCQARVLAAKACKASSWWCPLSANPDHRGGDDDDDAHNRHDDAEGEDGHADDDVKGGDRKLDKNCFSGSDMCPPGSHLCGKRQYFRDFRANLIFSLKYAFQGQDSHR